MRSERVTIRDVARRADVAISTVSRALNGSPEISQPTIDRVRSAAKELGYTVDQIGRALRNQSTSSLGLVVPNIANPFFPALIQAVEAEARRAGWSLVLADAQDSVDLEREAIDLLVGRRVDAIIISPCHRTRSTPALIAAAKSTSIVQIDRRCSATLAHVGVDQQAATVAVLNHLLLTGRRRFALLGVNTGEWTSHERVAAFKNWARVNLDAVITYEGESTLEFGRDAVHRVLSEHRDTDAIVCVNDLIAVGALLELESLDIKVPEAVAVTGFDNTLIGMVSRPALTTVAQPIDEIARRAVSIANSEEEELPSQYLFLGELIVRNSSQSSGNER